jgi:Tol biopolymer transport system component
LGVWSPNGKDIAFVRRKEKETATQIYIANLSTLPATVTSLTVTTTINMSPAWSPDGSAIAIATAPEPGGKYDIHLVSAQTGSFIMNLTGSNPESDALPVFGK